MTPDPAAVIGVRYESDRVWIDIVDANGVHSAPAPPELDPRRVAALEAAGRYLADVLRAGSTGNHTASQLGAVERWENALAAAPTETGTETPEQLAARMTRQFAERQGDA